MNNENFENGLRPNEITQDEITGIFIKDYTTLDYNALEEIIQLDEQLDNNLKTILSYINSGDYTKAITALKWLIEDNSTHKAYTDSCQTKIFNDMEKPDDRQRIISMLNSYHITDPLEVSICLNDIQSRGLTTEDEISQYIDEYLEGIENSV